MADDLKRAKDLITDHFMRQGKEYLKTDEGKFFLARILASRKDVKPFVPKGYARDVTVKEAGIAGGAINEARKVFNALQDMDSAEAVAYVNKGIKKLLKGIDPETTIKLYGATVGPKSDQRTIVAKRPVGPGVAGVTFTGDKLDFSGVAKIDYDTPEYGVSVNPQRRTARGRYNVGPVDATAFVDPRAKYAQVGGQYDAGRVGLFDTKFTGAVDTRKNVQGRVEFSAPMERITESLIGKPFGKAKGGKVKKYAKGGGVRRPKLK